MLYALKCRKFDYLKICKNVQFEYFSMNHFGQNFHFFSSAVIFSKFLDGIKEKAPKHQRR